MSDPIVIHAWWRSGSTYVWSKLRQSESCRCYYEPLHERIALLTTDAIIGPPEIDVSRALRHPIPQKHYFAEYAELLRTGELGYSSDLAYDRYLLLPGQADERLLAYLRGVIAAAAAAGRRPVLCFCRSQMRSAWMKDAFGGLHVAQIRNPADQWASFNIEPYFINKTIIIALKLHHSHPRAFAHIESFERLAQLLSKRSLLTTELTSRFFVSKKDALAVFLVIWVASALQAIAHCDLTLDMDMLSSDPDYRNTTSEWFATIGCPADFSDCALPSGELQVPSVLSDQMVEEAVCALRSGASSLVITNPDAIKKWLPSLSPLSRQILSLALGDK